MSGELIVSGYFLFSATDYIIYGRQMVYDTIRKLYLIR